MPGVPVALASGLSLMSSGKSVQGDNFVGKRHWVLVKARAAEHYV